jgi:hypothetical protein
LGISPTVLPKIVRASRALACSSSVKSA